MATNKPAPTKKEVKKKAAKVYAVPPEELEEAIKSAMTKYLRIRE